MARLSHRTLAKLSGLRGQPLEDFLVTWHELPPAERRLAVKTMAELAEDNVELDFNDLYRRFLKDPDAEVRSLAIEGLWEDERASTAELLIETVRTDAVESVRAVAVDGLGRFALRIALGEVSARVADRVRAMLLELVAPGQPHELRRRAVEAGGYLSEEPFRQATRAAYAGSDIRLQASAVRAMGRSADALWTDTIMRELRSEEPMMRFEAVRAAGEMEDARFVPALTDAVDDEDTEVRLAAIEALGLIGGQRARQALMRIRQGRDPVLADAAEAALDEMDTITAPLGVRVRDINPN